MDSLKSRAFFTRRTDLAIPNRVGVRVRGALIRLFSKLFGNFLAVVSAENYLISSGLSSLLPPFPPFIVESKLH